ncbi:MAG: DUF547 domain-containing protein [Hyphomicrobiaceae bacterium]
MNAMIGKLIKSAAMMALAICIPAVTVVHAADANPAFKRLAAGSTTTVDHAAWDRLLKAYVVSGADGLNRVAYARFKAEGHAALKAYVAALQKVDPATLDRSEQFAFWVNLYNAKTIDVVLDKYPVKSIKDISLGGGLKTLISGGPWQAKIMKVSGVDLTLDDVENTILRPIYRDPRVHYSVNCASVGCPNLAVEAYTGGKLEAMLEAGAKAFVNSPRGALVEGGTIKASSIYEWFQADFGGSEATVLDHLRKYASPALTEQLNKIGRIARYDYDWQLADAKQ